MRSIDILNNLNGLKKELLDLHEPHRQIHNCKRYWSRGYGHSGQFNVRAYHNLQVEGMRLGGNLYFAAHAVGQRLQT